jgi:hypothetical protein
MYALITAATSAEAYKLKNKLNSDNILLGDYADLPAFMISSGNIIKLPKPGSFSYAHEMLTLCLDKQIDTVYVMKDQEKVLLTEVRQLFTEYGIKIHSGAEI